MFWKGLNCRRIFFAGLVQGHRSFVRLATGVFRAINSPSPRPSPLGRGRRVIPPSEQRGAAEWRRTGERFSLSSGERAGVRGKEAFEFPKCSRSKRGLWAGTIFSGAASGPGVQHFWRDGQQFSLFSGERAEVT